MTLTRFYNTGKAVFGYLKVNGKCFFTMENSKYLIPEGVFNLSLYPSPKHGLVPLLNVPNRTYIEMHKIKSVEFLKGCIGVSNSANIEKNTLSPVRKPIDYINKLIEKKEYTQLLVLDYTIYD